MLLVEDEADARELLEVVIQYADGFVTAVSSAAAALAVLDTIVPDVMVVDIVMPGRDGYWLLDQVRNMAHAKHIPALAVTGRTRVHDRERAMSAGFKAYLAKPVDPLDFCRVIRELAIRRPS